MDLKSHLLDWEFGANPAKESMFLKDLAGQEGKGIDVEKIPVSREEAKCLDRIGFVMVLAGGLIAAALGYEPKE